MRHIAEILFVYPKHVFTVGATVCRLASQRSKYPWQQRDRAEVCPFSINDNVNHLPWINKYLIYSYNEMASAAQTDNELRRLLNNPVKNVTDEVSMAPPLSTNVPRPSTSQNVNPQSTMTPMLPAFSKKETIQPRLQNIVATVNLGIELKLMYINTRTRNSEYNPARFTGLVMRIREPRTTALIFRSGKLVCTGARCEEDSYLAARKFARIIQKLGFPVKFINFKVHNIVATCDLKFPIKLENLNHMHGQFSTYEPELFPGLIYRMVLPRVVLLIFVNGKIVLTGAKSRSELQDALTNIHPILKSFRKQ